MNVKTVLALIGAGLTLFAAYYCSRQPEERPKPGCTVVPMPDGTYIERDCE